MTDRAASFPFRLSTGEMPLAAAFDLDDTLISGDSQVEWIRWLNRLGLADGKYVDLMEQMLVDYHAGRLDMPQFLRDLAPAVSGFLPRELDELLERFIDDEIEKRVRPEGAALIAAARAAGMPVVIISATCSYVVRPLAKRFGISADDALGIDLVRTGDGRLTGEIDGAPSFREGKVSRLDAWLAAGNATGRFGPTRASAADIFFFTDSFNDLPLALHAGGAALVNPDPSLSLEGRRRGWPILSWRAPVDGPAKHWPHSDSAHAESKDGLSGADPDDPDETD